MIISLITAFDSNRIIGIDQKLPWKIHSDMKRFKALTIGKVVIMGRKTFESIGSKVLPDRANIIITSSKKIEDAYIMTQPSLLTVTTPEAALHLAITLAYSKQKMIKLETEPEIMVIGGSSIYKAYFPSATKLYITLVNASIKHNHTPDVAYFPEFNKDEWCMKEQEDKVEPGLLQGVPMDISFTFQTFERSAVQ